MPHQKENEHWHYGVISRSLHWTLAILIISMISIGWYMMSIAEQPDSRVFFNLHKSFGIITGVLVVLSVLWRINHKPAPLPVSVALWQVRVAHLVKMLLYVCMIAMPLTGFLGASFGQHGIAFFGWPIPTWVTQNAQLSEQLFEIHGVVVWVLVGLIAVHVLAALKHLLIDRDGVFQRMWK